MQSDLKYEHNVQADLRIQEQRAEINRLTAELRATEGRLNYHQKAHKELQGQLPADLLQRVSVAEAKYDRLLRRI